tara:strand:+ start:102 stop:989 length:888 start_codon:yes stop_codon:yes gene_type:complete
MNLRIAVVALTRGYPNDQSKYQTLIKRNLSIQKFIIKHRKNASDMILFHEGNISSLDQDYINSESEVEIKFVDVSKYFNNDGLILEGESKFSLGYRQMCRFNMFHIWDEVTDYDYILRVDEDIEINDFDPFIFEKMEEKKQIYLTGRFTKETHRLTNKTLPYFLLKNTDLNVDKVYNHRNPYTNLYASSVKFWNNEEIKSILKTIALTDQQIINRWGDHTVQGLLLNHKNIKIHLFPRLIYRHISHNLIIKNNLIRNLILNSKYNPVSINENIFVKLKLRIKGKIKSKNKYDFDS